MNFQGNAIFRAQRIGICHHESSSPTRRLDHYQGESSLSCRKGSRACVAGPVECSISAVALEIWLCTWCFPSLGWALLTKSMGQTGLCRGQRRRSRGDCGGGQTPMAAKRHSSSSRLSASLSLWTDSYSLAFSKAIAPRLATACTKYISSAVK